jgi:putative protease
MAYDLLDGNGNEVMDNEGKPIHQRYLLSLQDLDRSAYLSELIDAGVTTFKIEGRLKDADYVTNITAYYREKLDNLTPTLSTGRGSSSLEGRLGGVFTRSFTPNPEKTFHRGATDYFLHGRTPHMANWDTPKSTGEYVGEVLEAKGNTLRVRLKEGVVLHNGDGLTAGSEGFNVNGVEGNLVKINKELSISRYSDIPLYRNLDTEFIKNLKSERKIPVDILFRETEDGFELIYAPVDAKLSPLVGRVGEGFAKEPAKNEAKALETIRTQLSKLGDTPYVAREVRIETKPYFIPISILNEWRRNTII